MRRGGAGSAGLGDCAWARPQQAERSLTSLQFWLLQKWSRSPLCG